MVSDPDFSKASTIAHQLLNSPDDKRIPTSLAFHLSDIYLEELNKAIKASDSVCQ